MIEIEIKDINNNSKGKIELSEAIFGSAASESVVHTAVVSYLANQRQGTSATKTKGKVRGGGRKPYKQKKTGRARAGSIRSPIWKGGGVVFGPQPRDYSIKLTKNMRRVALSKALTMKLSDGEVAVLDSISMEKANTKEMASILKNMGFSRKTVLIVLPETQASEKYKNVLFSVRNIPVADIIRVSDLNAYHIAVFDYIIFTKDAILNLHSRLQGVIEAGTDEDNLRYN
ncbi:50S ribosomal protein L4 [Thermodesulfovibrionales bacterium]|nr:50S ribosomal protein L4 [Thermodesulfovibrionales bacterium]MCL0049815.1 50S ribosomal protein L4 [Thermodesulfovibrionales bacterium]MCL0062050.1 50S ribosomal protein L4 [Thermodesulfovibrionales bacterium]